MRKRKLLACLLTVGMLMSLIPSALAAGPTKADPTPDPIDYINGVKLGKTVTDQTDWKAKKEAQVTLEISAPDPKEPVAVEFVLDATESLLKSEDNGKTVVGRYLESVVKALSSDNVYVGVTVFANKAANLMQLTKDVTTTNINTLVGETITFAAANKGTNAQSGIQTGVASLTAQAEALNIKDTNRYLVFITDGGSFFYFDDQTLVGSYNEAADTPDKVSADLSALRNATGGGFNANADTNFEKAIVMSADAFDAIPSNIKVITYGIPYYANTDNLSNLTALAGSFVNYAIGKSDAGRMLGSIDDLKVVVPARSVVTDVMAFNSDKTQGEVYNFDVMTDKEFVLTFNDIKMSGKLEQNDQIVFKANDTIYGTLKYTKANDGTEKFTLTLGQDIKLGDKVTLSYYEKLTDYSSSTGTHYVYTNNSAALTPMGSQTDLAFPMPSLSYTVSGGGGGGGNKPVLNKEDHFGYIIGYPVDYFTGEPTTDQTKKPVRPQGNITRAEVATIFFRMLTDESRTEFWSQTNDYSDVKQGQWFNPAISTLSNAGIISGYPDGSFKPNGFITRAEFATIAVRFFDVQYDGKDLFPDISTHWAKDYINQAGSAGLVNGYPDGTFGPNKNITRAEAVTLVNRTLDRHPDQEHFLKDMLVWPDNMDTTKWYYADMQEATNSHEYEMKTASDGTKYEIWTKMLPIRDWEAFEKAWSDANSATNPGEVVNKPSTSK